MWKDYDPTILNQFTGLVEKIQKAKALKQELDYLYENGVIDDRQYNALLDSNPDIVEKIIPKIYDTALKKMELEYKQQQEQAKAEQPRYKVELVKGDQGVKMVVYDERDPLETIKEKWLTKTEAKQVAKDLAKKWKAQIVDGKVVYIPPTPEENVIVKDLSKYGIQTGTRGGGGRAGGGAGGKQQKFKLSKIYGNIGGAILYDPYGNVFEVKPKIEGESLKIDLEPTLRIEYDENKKPIKIPLTPEQKKKLKQQAIQQIQQNQSLLGKIVNGVLGAIESTYNFIKPDDEEKQLKEQMQKNILEEYGYPQEYQPINPFEVQ